MKPAGRALLPVLAAAAAVTLLGGCGVISPHSQAVGNAGSSTHSNAPAATPSTSLPYNMSGLLDPTGAKFFGVEAQDAPALRPVSAFASSVGKKPDIIGQYLAWDSSFNSKAVTTAWSYGAMYYIAWEP